MAHIINLEGNVEFLICLSNMIDYNSYRNDYENWIPFILCLTLPNKCSKIEKDAKAAMSIFELKNLLRGFEELLVHLDNQENYVFRYNNSEGFFEIDLEIIPEDNVVEIEIWINVGNQTNGKIYGYDEGVRFISCKEMISDFLVDLKKESVCIKGVNL